MRGDCHGPKDVRMPKCKGINIEEATVIQLQQWLSNGTFSARDLTTCYLGRIEQLNSRLRAVIEVNPDAQDIAAQMDRERGDGIVRGPLHGIPFLVKDNIATKDKMQTTAGSNMLVGTKVSEDSRVVQLAREAGAVLLGHANMSEWASMRSTYYAEGYSGRGGQSRNPYNLAEHPGGSSSGSAIAVAANMCAFSLGTETDSSVIFPADRNGVVGIKPTVGSTSRVGVIPECHNLDTVGTFGRTVSAASLALDAILERSNASAAGMCFHSQVCGKEALEGAKFGMPWKRIWDKASEELKAVQISALHSLIEKIRGAGAHIYQCDIPSAEEMVPCGGGWDWDYASKVGHPEQSEYTVVKVDFYNDLKDYLAALEANPNNIKRLEDVVEYNIKHTEHEGGVSNTHPAWPTGQDSFIQSVESKGAENDVYRAALKYIRTKSREEGIDQALLYEGEILDGLLIPVQADDGVAVQIAAKAGYPMITIPVGVDSNGVPFGIAIIHKAFEEEKLVRYGSAIEALVGSRPKPQFHNFDAEGYMYVGVCPETAC